MFWTAKALGLNPTNEMQSSLKNRECFLDCGSWKKRNHRKTNIDIIKSYYHWSTNLRIFTTKLIVINQKHNFQRVKPAVANLKFVYNLVKLLNIPSDVRKVIKSSLTVVGRCPSKRRIGTGLICINKLAILCKSEVVPKMKWVLITCWSWTTESSITLYY